MKIILLKTHEKLGNPGDVVNVKAGYARNFLFPQRIAQLATTSNIKALNSLIEQQEKQEAKNRENIELLSIIQYITISSLYPDFHNGEYGRFLFLLGKYKLAKKYFLFLKKRTKLDKINRKKMKFIMD